MTAIEVKYNQVVASGFKIGNATNAESVCADGKGHYRHFDGGSIFWNGQTGTPAYHIYGRILAKWSALGWERSPLGYPTTDETAAGSGNGNRYNNFQSGIIMYNAGRNEAFAIYGPIYQKWAQQGYDVGSFGLPTSDDTMCADGKGHYGHFDGGSIFWNGQSGTPPYLIYGLIRAKWFALGWERGSLGYPTTDETAAGSGNGNRYNLFQNGIIMYNAGRNETFAISGAIYQKWAEEGYDIGSLGLPITDELGIPGSSRKHQYFDGGLIVWTSKTGTTVFKGAKKSDKKVAIVLSGGGSKGDFQLGALAALYEAGIRPDILCATSVGSLNALMLTQGEDGLDKLKKIWFGLFRNEHMWRLDDWWNEVDADLRDPFVSALQGEKSSLSPFLDKAFTGGILGGIGGLFLLGPLGAILGFLSGAGVPSIEKIQRFAQLITGKARALLNMNPIRTLFNKYLSDPTPINNWIASGKQLRLAMVGLNSGELCYVTETGDLINRDQNRLLETGITLIEGGMASSAIASIFPPVQFAKDNWVDGGHREYAPLKAALDMGATEVYVICAGPVSRSSTVNYTEDGIIGADFGNKSLVDIAVRAILDITGDETATSDVFPLVDTSAAKIRLIIPTFPTHDLVTIDPNLIRVNYNYGYRVASDMLINANSDLLEISNQIALKQSRLFRLNNKVWKSVNITFSNEIDTLRQDIDALTKRRRDAGAKVNGPDVQNPFSPIANTMQCGDMLLPGQSIVSTDGQFILVYQTDGNVVLYDNTNGGMNPIWASNTAGTTLGCCVFQCDGNLVIYDATLKNAVWASSWASNWKPNPLFAPENQMKQGHVLSVENGYVAIYELGRKMIWQTKNVQNPVLKVSINNTTSRNVTVRFYDFDKFDYVFTTIGRPNGIAMANAITSFDLPTGYAKIQVTIEDNKENPQKLSAGETYTYENAPVHVLNKTDIDVTVRFYHPLDHTLTDTTVLNVIATPLLVADSTHVVPARSNWFWTMPDNLDSVQYTFNDRKTEAAVVFRGQEAPYNKPPTVVIHNRSGRTVRFIIFKWDDPILPIVNRPLPSGDINIPANSYAIFTAPPDVTVKVQVRGDVKNVFAGDNRIKAQKEIAYLGEILFFNEDGSVERG